MTATYDLPANYRPLLNTRDVETAIKDIKDFFERNLAAALGLQRVTAPLFVRSGTGINDDLNGVEQPLRFCVKDDGGVPVEIVQSLAKWKRLALKRYGYQAGEGIYTDMNAIRPDETLDNIHSIYVDQWDWEKIIAPEERNRETLEAVVRAIYDVVCRTEFHVASQ
jgi:aspartate--ammonia ligase